MRNRILLSSAAALASLTLLSACGHNPSSHPMGSMSNMPTSSSNATANLGGMSGMPMPTGTGLADTKNGYALTINSQPMAGMAMPVTFTITKGGRAVTLFDREQTKLLHFYLIRSDLSGFQHLHPTMDAAGTWSVTPSSLTPGSYRIYTQFIPHADASNGPIVLSHPVTVSGTGSTPVALPPASTTTAIDGYTITVTGSPMAGKDSLLTLAFSKAGQPVADLQPYLDTYAHVTAIRQGDLAFAHVHPDGSATSAGGGPSLTLHAELPETGTYRLFIQFQTAGHLHTAAITTTVA